MNHNDVIRCPKCGSGKVFRFQLDQDWSRDGDYWPVNDEELYTEEELKSVKPDIYIYHCLHCDELFNDPFKEEKTMLEIKVTIEAPALTEALNNLAVSFGKGGAEKAPALKANEIPATQEPSTEDAPAMNSTIYTAFPMPPTQQSPVNPVLQTPTTPVQQTATQAQQVSMAPAPAQTQAAPITLDAISRAGAALVDQGKMQQIMALLGKYGVQAITQLNANAYEAFAADLRALGAAI